MLKTWEAGCFWCPHSFPFFYRAHSVAYKPHISQYPIPTTRFKLSQYSLTHPHLTASHQDTFTSTPPYPNLSQSTPNSTHPILSHSTPILTDPFLSCPIGYPLNHLIALPPTLSIPPQTIVFHSTLFFSIPPPIPIHPNSLHPIPTPPCGSRSYRNSLFPT